MYFTSLDEGISSWLGFVGLKFVSSATAGSEGAFQRKGSHPHLGGMKVKALRIYVLDRRKRPESSSLT